MFNLLVKYSGWAESRDSIPIGRILEYTDQALVDRFRPLKNGAADGTTGRAVVIRAYNTSDS